MYTTKKDHRSNGGKTITGTVKKRRKQWQHHKIQAQKNIFFSYGATKIFFANPQQTTFKSTLFRMIYLTQPNAGLSLLTRQLFSGRVITILGCSSGLEVIKYQPMAEPQG
jgi:hypothetical protein